MQEIWSKIKGYDDYLISNFGNLKSKKSGQWKVLNPYVTNFGYKRTRISNREKSIHCFIHKLVASAFVANDCNKPFVNHIDGNKLNNHFTNLEWVTLKENNCHSWEIGLRENQKRALSQNKKKKIIDTKSNLIFDSLESAAKHYNIKRTTLSAMLIGQNPNKTNLKYL